MTTQSTSIRVMSVVASLAVLAFVGGCSEGRPDRVKVSGQVLIEDKPLTYGHVRFIPTGARSSEGKLDDTGHFTLTCYDGDDGAVPGVHRIEIASAEPLSATRLRWHAPKKYANFNTSGLEQEITESTDSVVVKLKWDGGKPFVEGAANGGACFSLRGDGWQSREIHGTPHANRTTLSVHYHPCRVVGAAGTRR